jgi:c-di-GMP phosphodiesterase
MADLFVGRQPIFNRRLEVMGYELLYRSMQADRANVTDGDQATAEVLTHTFSQLGLDTLVDGQKKVFINATRSFLVGRYPLPFPPTNVVLEVPEDIQVDQVLIQALRALAKQGFQIALDDVISMEQIAHLWSLADIVKIDLMGTSRAQMLDIVARLRPHHQRLKLLAEKVETQEELQICRQAGFDYFQGYFLCKPSVIKGRGLDSVRLILIQSLAQIQDPKADFHSLGNLVAQDVTLSYKVLRLVNSAYYALPQTITTIDQAVGLIGMNQLRGWLTLLLLTSIEGKPHELTTIAVARAKMCELLAVSLRQGQTEPFFLVGLFSVLDAMLDLPMPDALLNLPLSEAVKLALLEHTGLMGNVLDTALAYERGRWDDLTRIVLSPEIIQQDYLEAIRWTTEVTRSLDSESDAF